MQGVFQEMGGAPYTKLCSVFALRAWKSFAAVWVSICPKSNEGSLRDKGQIPLAAEANASPAPV